LLCSAAAGASISVLLLCGVWRTLGSAL
jgi:hypothetical protein